MIYSSCNFLSNVIIINLTINDQSSSISIIPIHHSSISQEIDRTEFREIAKEIQSDARRRNLISVAAAAIGAVS